MMRCHVSEEVRVIINTHCVSCYVAYNNIADTSIQDSLQDILSIAINIITAYNPFACLIASPQSKPQVVGIKVAQLLGVPLSEVNSGILHWRDEDRGPGGPACRMSHLSNATFLTLAFFESGEECSKQW